MKRAKGLIVMGMLLLAGLAMLSCAGSQEGVDKETSSQGVEMHLRLSQTTMSPGEILKVHAEIENISGEELEYTMWNIGDPAIYIKVHTPYETSVILKAPEEPEIVQPAVTFDSLNPGETIKREVSWTIGEQDPNGTYTVEASFFPGRQIDDQDLEAVVLSCQVEITDSFDITPKQEVYTIAATNPSIELWLRGHIGEAVAREQKRDYLVNIGGEWQSTNRELYQEALDASKSPALSLDLDSEPKQWLITYFSKFGFPPSEVTLSLNAKTGEVINVKPDLLAELDGGVVATFQVGNSQFRAFVTNGDVIEQLYALQRGEIQASIPVSNLLPGPGAGMHNAPWSWHLDPEQFGLAEMTIEVCDGTPQFVEEELDYWLNQVGQYCPWSAELVGIEDYRS